jgi:hypothetical protein
MVVVGLVGIFGQVWPDSATKASGYQWRAELPIGRGGLSVGGDGRGVVRAGW